MLSSRLPLVGQVKEGFGLPGRLSSFPRCDSVCFVFNPVFLGKTVGVSHTSRWGIWGHQFYVSVKTSIIKLYFIACTPKQAAVLGLEGLQCGPQGLLLPTRLLPAALDCQGLHVQKELRPVPPRQSSEESLAPHLYFGTYVKQNEGWGGGSALQSTHCLWRAAWIPAATWWRLIAVCHSSSEGSDAVCWLLGAPGVHVVVNTYTHGQTQSYT